MKKLALLLVLSLFPATFALADQPPRYAVATTATPVLNTPSFHHVFGGTIKLDPCQGVRPIEFVALAGTLFRIEGALKDRELTIFRVTTNDYPYPTRTGYFVDARFLKEVAGAPQERPRALPELAEVQKRLLAALGKPYVWGGNLQDGVPLLRELYPQADPLAGVDCSGLLYQATGGFTPRNTSALTTFGAAVPVAGLTAQQIARKLQPLDLIAWKGHVMVVLDRDSIIQSTMGCQGGINGVHVGPIEATLRTLMARRKPLDDYAQVKTEVRGFVVRRWFPR